jgi:hypothetical protein
MPSLLKFDDIKNRIDWAARKARTACAIGRTPVDLGALCDQVGIHVEWRKMVPEGVTSVSPNRVSIYLQSNFGDDPRFRRRLRFTFAHEICHALFYEGFPDNPRPLAGIPKGAALEKLCQQGAGYLLAPTDLLPSTVTLSSAKDFAQLADDFDVSMDVLIRRVHQVNRLLPQDFAMLLLRTRDHKLSIDAAAFCSLPDSRLRTPEIGEDYSKWSEPITTGATKIASNTWIKKVGPHQLELRRIPRFAHSELVEIQRTVSADPEVAAE